MKHPHGLRAAGIAAAVATAILVAGGAVTASASAPRGSAPPDDGRPSTTRVSTNTTTTTTTGSVRRSTTTVPPTEPTVTVPRPQPTPAEPQVAPTSSPTATLQPAATLVPATSTVEANVIEVLDPPGAPPDPDSCVPVAANDYYATVHDVVLVVPFESRFTANDLTCEGPLLSIVVGAPGHGTLELLAGGAFEYTPDPGFTGFDGFAYHYEDGDHVVITDAVVSIWVSETCQLVATHDVFTTGVGENLSVAAPGFLANDSISGCSVSDILVIPTPGNDGLITSPNPTTGAFEYQAPGFAGTDTFLYLFMTFEPCPPEPQLPCTGAKIGGAVITIHTVEECDVSLGDDTYTTPAGQTLHVAPPGPGTNDTLCPAADELQLVAAPSHGSLTLLGSGDLTYTPDQGFLGSDSFIYTVAGPPEPSGFAGRPSRRPVSTQQPVATVTIVVTDGSLGTDPPVTGEPEPGTTAPPAAGTTGDPATAVGGQLPATGAGSWVLQLASASLAVGMLLIVMARRRAF